MALRLLTITGCDVTCDFCVNSVLLYAKKGWFVFPHHRSCTALLWRSATVWYRYQHSSILTMKGTERGGAVARLRTTTAHQPVRVLGCWFRLRCIVIWIALCGRLLLKAIHHNGDFVLSCKRRFMRLVYSGSSWGLMVEGWGGLESMSVRQSAIRTKEERKRARESEVSWERANLIWATDLISADERGEFVAIFCRAFRNAESGSSCEADVCSHLCPHSRDLTPTPCNYACCN